MKQYLELLQHVIEHGKDRQDRTGTGTRSVFGAQMRVNLADGFPLLTTKKVHFKSVVGELLWFLRGHTNIQYLHDHGVTIWDEWADKDGELGPVYGKQWRRWGQGDGRPDIDQVGNLVKDLISNPFSRRHIVSAWNPADVAKVKLPPCHTLWQCYVEAPPQVWEGATSRLHLHLYARSIDIFLGLPFNIASYALLLTLLARSTAMVPGELIISFGDLHLYANHFEQAREQLGRKPMRLPQLGLASPVPLLEELVFDDISLTGYNPQASIKAPIAV